MIEFIQNLFHNYSNFFSWDAFILTISNPVNWATIGALILLEGLLSADNALVLAVIVKHLPDKSQQKKALFYGILGAYVFRFLAIGLGSYLVAFTWIKILGGCYLLYIAIKNLFFDGSEEEAENKKFSFWRTVLVVELMDIAFSIDSVLAAFGVSEQVWVLYLGGILGVLMMRSVAHVFLKLIEKFPELEKTAFIIIIIIGIKMILASFGLEISPILFFAILIATFFGTIALSSLRNTKKEEIEV